LEVEEGEEVEVVVVERFDDDVEFIFGTDIVGKADLINFSATDFKLDESTNKNGNKVEGKIGGIFKFGLVFKVVEIGNEGIVVGNGKLVNGTIGFGIILAVVEVVVDDSVIFDEDGVKVVELAVLVFIALDVIVGVFNDIDDFVEDGNNDEVAFDDGLVVKIDNDLVIDFFG